MSFFIYFYSGEVEKYRVMHIVNYDIVRDKMRQNNPIYGIFRHLSEQDYSFRELREHLPITDTELMDSLSYLKRNKLIDGESTYSITEEGQELISIMDKEAETMAKKSKKHLDAILGAEQGKNEVVD